MGSATAAAQEADAVCVARVSSVADASGSFPQFSQQRNLISIYPQRSFRFCYSNSQMVRAVSDYVMHDPTLRPGPTYWPEARLAGSAAAGPWPLVPSLGSDSRRTRTLCPLKSSLARLRSEPPPTRIRAASS